MTRYIQRFCLPERQHIAGAPAVLSVGQLLEDTQENRLVVQLKWTAASQKILCGLKATVIGMDEAGNELCRKEHKYYYTVLRGYAFGMYDAVILENLDVKRIAVELNTAVFADGTKWAAENQNWYALPSKEERLAGAKKKREEAAAKRAAEIEKVKQEAAAKTAAAKEILEAKKTVAIEKLNKAAAEIEVPKVTGRKKLPIILAACFIVLAAVGSQFLKSGEEQVHVTTEYDMETVTLELTEEDGELYINIEDVQGYIPEAKYLKWDGTPAMGDDIDEYLRDSYHMACLIGSKGEEGCDDDSDNISVGNNPKSTRALLIYSELTTLCGYSVGVPEDLGDGKWAIDLTHCDYDFTGMYKEQERAFYSRTEYEFIPLEEIEKHAPASFIYAYTMGNIREEYSMRQMYHIWQQANSQYLNHHLRDFAEQWESRVPQEDDDDPVWRYYLLYDENQEVIGYTIRSNVAADWFNTNILTTPYDIETVTLTADVEEDGIEIELEDLQAVFPEVVSFERMDVNDRSLSIDEYLKVGQQMEMLVTSNGEQSHKQRSMRMGVWNNQTYILLLYSDDKTLCGYFAGSLMAEDDQISIDFTRCNYDFSALYQKVSEEFSELNWENELKYIDIEKLDQSDAKWFISTYFMSDKIENVKERHWYHLWSRYQVFKNEKDYVPLEYMDDWYGDVEHDNPVSMYFLLLDDHYEIVGYTIMK